MIKNIYLVLNLMIKFRIVESNLFSIELYYFKGKLKFTQQK